jgi:hypothetical protein
MHNLSGEEEEEHGDDDNKSRKAILQQVTYPSSNDLVRFRAGRLHAHVYRNPELNIRQKGSICKAVVRTQTLIRNYPCAREVVLWVGRTDRRGFWGFIWRMLKGVLWSPISLRAPTAVEAA